MSYDSCFLLTAAMSFQVSHLHVRNYMPIASYVKMASFNFWNVIEGLGMQVFYRQSFLLNIIMSC